LICHSTAYRTGGYACARQNAAVHVLVDVDVSTSKEAL
jgi:hypothetical protein